VGLLVTLAVFGPLVGLVGATWFLTGGLTDFAKMASDLPIPGETDARDFANTSTPPNIEQPAQVLGSNKSVAQGAAIQPNAAARADHPASKSDALDSERLAAVGPRSPERSVQDRLILERHAQEVRANSYGIIGEPLSLFLWGLLVAGPAFKRSAGFLALRYAPPRYRGSSFAGRRHCATPMATVGI